MVCVCMCVARVGGYIHTGGDSYWQWAFIRFPPPLGLAALSPLETCPPPPQRQVSHNLLSPPRNRDRYDHHHPPLSPRRGLYFNHTGLKIPTPVMRRASAERRRGGQSHGRERDAVCSERESCALTNEPLMSLVFSPLSIHSFKNSSFSRGREKRKKRAHALLRFPLRKQGSPGKKP